jgi:hypothetical protein
MGSSFSWKTLHTVWYIEAFNKIYTLMETMRKVSALDILPHFPYVERHVCTFSTFLQ